MITVTTVKAEIQARINAVTGATEINDLLKLRQAAASMGVSHATIEAEIQARANAVTGATSINDLLKLGSLSVRADKRIGEIVKSPFKAPTLDDGALIRMAGVKVLKSAYPALAEVYTDQVLFGQQVSLESALSAAGVSAAPYMYDPVYANGVLLIPSQSDKIIRSTDGATFAKVGPALAFTSIAYDPVNLRWWAGTGSGLLYYSIDNGLTWAQNSAYSNGGYQVTSISISRSGVVLTVFMHGPSSAGGARCSSNVGSSWADSTISGGLAAHGVYSDAHGVFIIAARNTGSLFTSSDGVTFSESGAITSVNMPGSAKYYRRLRVFGDYIVLQTGFEQHVIRVGASGGGIGASKVIGVSEISADVSTSNICLFAQLFDGSIVALPRAAVTRKPVSLYRYSDIYNLKAAPVLSSVVGVMQDNYSGDALMYGGTIYSGVADTPWGVFVSVSQARDKCILIPTKNYLSTEMYLPDIAPQLDSGGPLYSYVVAK